MHRSVIVVLVVVVGLVAAPAAAQLPPPPGGPSAPAAAPSEQVVLLAGRALVTVDVRDPSTPSAIVPVRGDEADPIADIDVRPATGELVGLGAGGQLYTLDLDGQATPVGAPVDLPTSLVAVAIDVNPVVDLLRVVATPEMTEDGPVAPVNLRVDPDTAALVAADPDLAYDGGDVAAGAVPQVGGAAYTEPIDGTTRTVLYALDHARRALVTQGSRDGTVSANTGRLFTVASDLDGVREFSAFDVSQRGQGLYLGGSAARAALYRVDLDTGRVEVLGDLPVPGTPAMAVLPTVLRFDGPDRVATAAAISRATAEPGVAAAVVASAADFPDGLSGGAAAAALGGPVLLVDRDAVPEVTAVELRRLEPGRIVLLGGTDRVTPAVEGELAGFTDGTVTRLAGPDRYATAVAVSAATFEGGPLQPVGGVAVATGEAFPDALAGSALAARLGGPVLLVRPDEVPEGVEGEISRLDPDEIVLLGGTSAVSAAVEAELAEVAPIRRLSGPDRYATAAEAAEAPSDVVYVATGTGFADALAGGAAAGAAGAPLLLTDTDRVPAATVEAVQRLRPRLLVVLGGTQTVADPTVRALLAAADG